MKIEDRVGSLEQDVNTLKLERVHCSEIHKNRLDVIEKNVTEEKSKNEQLQKRVDKTNLSLTLLAKQFKDYMALRNAINTRLWVIFSALIITLITFMGSLTYKTIFLPKEDVEMQKKIENIEKMMGEISKSFKEQKRQ